MSNVFNKFTLNVIVFHFYRDIKPDNILFDETGKPHSLKYATNPSN